MVENSQTSLFLREIPHTAGDNVESYGLIVGVARTVNAHVASYATKTKPAG